jgi:hypothetical protein
MMMMMVMKSVNQGLIPIKNILNMMMIVIADRLWQCLNVQDMRKPLAFRRKLAFYQKYRYRGRAPPIAGTESQRRREHDHRIHEFSTLFSAKGDRLAEYSLFTGESQGMMMMMMMMMMVMIIISNNNNSSSSSSNNNNHNSIITIVP